MAAIKGITAFDGHGFTGSPLPQQVLVWKVPARAVMEAEEEAVRRTYFIGPTPFFTLDYREG
jgi:hypothetical protein